MSKTKIQLENDIIELRENLSSMDARDPDMLDVLDRMQILRRELDDIEAYEIDIAMAKELLERHGVAFRLFTREDITERVGQLPGMYTTGDPYAVVQHVYEGDDWKNLSTCENTEDDSNIWAMIHGTAHDHPEWFSDKARAKL